MILLLDVLVLNYKYFINTLHYKVAALSHFTSWIVNEHWNDIWYAITSGRATNILSLARKLPKLKRKFGSDDAIKGPATRGRDKKKKKRKKNEGRTVFVSACFCWQVGVGEGPMFMLQADRSPTRCLIMHGRPTLKVAATTGIRVYFRLVAHFGPLCLPDLW